MYKLAQKLFNSLELRKIKHKKTLASGNSLREREWNNLMRYFAHN